MPNLYIMAGPNRAGKTTAAYTLLPEVLGVFELSMLMKSRVDCRRFSLIQWPWKPNVSGCIMLQRIDFLIGKDVDFAIETTLSTRSYVQTIRRAQQLGYVVSLYYFWIPSAEVSKERVAIRVSRGGHTIPPDVIERRYERSLFNLTNLYIPICDYFAIFNNAGIISEMVATGGIDSEFNVLDEDIWKTILNYESKPDKTE